MKLIFYTYLVLTIISNIPSEVSAVSAEPYYLHLQNQSYLKRISQKVCVNKTNLQLKTLQSTAGRLILNQRIMREFLQNTFNKGIESALGANFQVILYISTVILILVSLFFLWYFLLTNGRLSLIHFDKKQKHVKNSLLIGIIFISLLILIPGFSGFLTVQQISSAVKDSICIYLTGNQGITKSPILKIQGSDKDYFSLDVQNFQIKIAQLQEHGYKIIKSSQIKKIVALSKELDQNQLIKRFSIGQNAQKLLQDVTKLVNLTKQASIFINYFRQKLKENRETLIKYIEKIDLLFSVQNFALFITLWPNLLFIITIMSSIVILVLFIKLRVEKASLSKTIFQNLFFFQGLIILLFLLTLILLIISEHIVQANCFILHDTHNKKLFQQYYETYNEREEPLLRQYVRKKEGHQSGRFNIFYDKDFIEINNNIIDHFQRIMNFSKLKQAQFNIKESLIDQNKKLIHQNVLINQINYFSIENIEFFSSLSQLFQDRNTASNCSILDYNIEEIGLYQRRFLYETCHIDLNIIISLNNSILIVILLKLTFLMMISRQENTSLSKIIRIQSYLKPQENENTQFISSF